MQRYFLCSLHQGVGELPKLDSHVFTHTDYSPSPGNRARPILVFLIHPKADYAGKNVLLSLKIDTDSTEETRLELGLLAWGLYLYIILGPPKGQVLIVFSEISIINIHLYLSHDWL